jgi:hypothetical protein
LNCSLDSILEVMKKKVMSWQRIEELTDQRDKDLIWIQELGREVNQLDEKATRIWKQLRDNQKEREWEERAMNRLEQANRTVIRIFKLDREEEIWKNLIKDFLEKGDKKYRPIFGAITKLFKNIDQSLTKFTNAIQPMTNC